MWFELRISGREHVSREWATGNRIIVLHNSETQEGPGAGNETHSHTVYLRFGTREVVKEKATYSQFTQL